MKPDINKELENNLNRKYKEKLPKGYKLKVMQNEEGNPIITISLDKEESE